MSVTVRVPAPLQKLTQNQAEVKANGRTVRELIDNLSENFPGIKERICDETGKVRKFINIYVNEEDVRFLQMDETGLKDGDEVSIIPAIAGGRDVGNCPERSRGAIAGGEK
ncbi:MAG: molybdopterin synthase sulfur carrier subunit [Candidatus Omnitrophica bacterium CG_4_8_14_3_um_filter_43_15]|nr:MAG: molybdopterin synthase sulfur carrier subunit [Candidatus Omnitrophica bacterium CG_4_8_14_3_um_filter_43_15]